MNGFLFLLLTIGLLVMFQIQTGVLGNQTTPVPGIPTIRTTMTTTQTTTQTTTSTTTRHPMSTAEAKETLTTKKKPKSGAPALSDMGVGSFFLFLINVLIHLLHLS
ncbi:CAMPATH-1 antigen-like [Octodon degus]|uniref:CAMPATH-1 antigen n=1 Tax=Octodon degus TaxID=10160 RepID=A0A6P6DFR6_OCTDE|nr:CAMPATH-1 antigen-like [Octodon degus]